MGKWFLLRKPRAGCVPVRTPSVSSGIACVQARTLRRSRRFLAWSAVALVGLSLLSPAPAQELANQPFSLQIPDGLAAGPQHWTSPEGLSSTIQVMLLLTVLSLAPAVLLMKSLSTREREGLLNEANINRPPPSQLAAVQLFPSKWPLTIVVS